MQLFLTDRTAHSMIGCCHDTVVCPTVSDCMSVTLCILWLNDRCSSKNCPNKWIGSSRRNTILKLRHLNLTLYTDYIPWNSQLLKHERWCHLLCKLVKSLDCPEAITCVLLWRSYTGCQWCTESSLSWHYCDVHNPHTLVLRLPDRFCTPLQQQWSGMHAIGSAWRPAPTTLFHVWGRNLVTELSLWPGQSCGTGCQ